MDIYFTQGCAWPPVATQQEYLDELLRNDGGGRFTVVTRQAGIAENGFSQGVAVGDYDNDGFADLYVANVGANRLYHNNGDGTFSDVSEQAGLAPPAWTASCLLADLNGDGLPDLYDVNYLQGRDLYERLCQRNGRPAACVPSDFWPAPDAVLFNSGDGSFIAADPASGFESDHGNGLGIVAADFERRGLLDVFVANDVDANFFFANRTSPPGSAARFSEEGVLRGVAFNGQGRGMASMGVAAGDANGDGLLDLFTTNFYHETNTLYLAGPAGQFTDATARSGLDEPSYDMLGFGTQFLDAQLDGRPDLVVANGHIDSQSAGETPAGMRPQFFENLGDARFVVEGRAELTVLPR